MPRKLVSLAILIAALIVAMPSRGRQGRTSSLDVGIPLEAIMRENGCLEPARAQANNSWPPGWDKVSMAGGDVPPARVVRDPYPTFHGVAVDPQNNLVVMSDSNRHGLWMYERTAGSLTSKEAAIPRAGIRGPATGMMFVATVALDPGRREIYTVDNDIGDRLETFTYDQTGNVKPVRVLDVPHQAWGIALSQKRDEVAVSVESSRMVVVYRRGSKDNALPLRVLRGPSTGMGDPHGIGFDDVHDELVVANHGNQSSGVFRREMKTQDADTVRSGQAHKDPWQGGRWEPPSVTIYRADAAGDAKPVRTIQGPKTGLDWPMGVSIDNTNGEIAVANNGDSSIRIFSRTASGDVAPLRVIKGPRTGISGPMGVAIDVKNDEIWVSNYGDHTAVVFARTATGNVAPKRILRNAPEGAPTSGFGNPGAIAFDSKRDEILVPNCVSEPRISAFVRLASGNVKPVRIIAGQATKLSRTMHGIYYDRKHDEMFVPVALAGAVLVFRGGATGAEEPIRMLQGPGTQIVRPDTLYVDEEHNELIVDSGADSILIFDREAKGEAAPIRVIKGQKTGIANMYGLTADPSRNLIFAANRVGEENGRDTTDSILVFNRTDNGDVAPRARIGGPRTGMLKIRQLQADPERGHLFVTVKNNRENYDPNALNPSPWNPERTGFIGVWNATDDGDVPPKAIIKGPATGLVWPAGVAINPATAEVFAIDSVSNSLFMFSMPELFRRPSGTANSTGR